MFEKASLNIVFGPNFQACKEKLQIHEDNVKDAIIHYDTTQELTMNGLHIVFYTKKQVATQSIVIVCGNLAKENYIVQWAFSILSSQIDNPEENEPLVLIQQFARKYGLELRIGTQRSRFILKESFPLSNTTESDLLQVINPKNHSFFLVQYLQIKEEKNERIALCALAFCIDSDEYLAAVPESISGEGMISLAQQVKTMMAPLDFTATKGTITFWIPYSQVGEGKSGHIFRVSFPGYYFEAGFTENELYLQRNGHRAAISFDTAENSQNMMNCYLMWEPTKLSVIILDPTYGRSISSGADRIKEVEKRTKSIDTSATLPPNSIIEWARKLNILPVKIYESMEDFYQSVIIAIQSIDDKVSSTNMYNAFWDITYDRLRIIFKSPKRETDIVSTIHGLLFDAALLKNFQIYPEHPLASGRLDFLLSGYLRTGAIANACIEFKHAHSSDLYDGLTKQLPVYMRAKGCSFGIYCVLYFRGPHFDKPNETIPDMEYRLKNLVSSEGLTQINVIALDLSKPVPPSSL
jgi:hypothetical protein